MSKFPPEQSICGLKMVNGRYTGLDSFFLHEKNGWVKICTLYDFKNKRLSNWINAYPAVNQLNTLYLCSPEWKEFFASRVRIQKFCKKKPSLLVKSVLLEVGLHLPKEFGLCIIDAVDPGGHFLCSDANEVMYRVFITVSKQQRESCAKEFGDYSK